ncbi:winged helix-turn-helix transcriptional regulator [Streptomyces sp. NPDC059396]|uniref:winged helix-turn-helix transcriptional regulator n=1 Tax=Streptomyces sp. NPDC059396 TaxID=3346819 RepID=UPI0036C2FEBC
MERAYLGTLSHGESKRYGELRSRIAGVSQKMLTQTLRGLERDGLVTRTIYPVVPPHVEYALTPLGETLRGPLTAVAHWSAEHTSEVLTAQEQYDVRATSAQ